MTVCGYWLYKFLKDDHLSLSAIKDYSFTYLELVVTIGLVGWVLRIGCNVSFVQHPAHIISDIMTCWYCNETQTLTAQNIENILLYSLSLH